jgi:hypothetical protein
MNDSFQKARRAAIRRKILPSEGRKKYALCDGGRFFNASPLKVRRLYVYEGMGGFARTLAASVKTWYRVYGEATEGVFR